MSRNVLVAVVLGCVLVGISLSVQYQSFAAFFSDTTSDELTVKRVKDQNVYGNRLAQTTIVEFSDYECPFCAKIHTTLKTIVDNSEGTINWQYRHLPLPIHSNASEAAEVAECIYKLAGNDAFWTFSNTTLLNQKNISSNYLQEQALSFGLTNDELETCIKSSEIEQIIDTDMAVAEALGARGTPFSVIVHPDGSTTPVRGALPPEAWGSLLSDYEK